MNNIQWGHLLRGFLMLYACIDLYFKYMVVCDILVFALINGHFLKWGGISTQKFYTKILFCWHKCCSYFAHRVNCLTVLHIKYGNKCQEINVCVSVGCLCSPFCWYMIIKVINDQKLWSFLWQIGTYMPQK